MKTQISHLRSGLKNQMLNDNIDYSNEARQGFSHTGTNQLIVEQVWQKVTSENPEFLTIKIKGLTLRLKANWSVSGKTCTYCGSLTREQLVEVFGMTPARNKEPYIHIGFGNYVYISNGKANSKTLCPSFIEII